MKATEILSSEHRVIERLLDSLNSATEKLQQGQPVRPGFFLDTADFIKVFADGCHHHKEEGVLFKVMIQNGMPLEGGPVSVMLNEHDQGRTFTRGMREAAERLQSGDSSARQAVIENARNYVALLRQHIYKEDHILFPMADSIIPTSQHNQVVEDFERIELEETKRGIHEKYLALAESLEKEIRDN